MSKENRAAEMDHVFHYPIEGDQKPQRDTLSEMVRKQLESTLGLLTFYLNPAIRDKNRNR